MCIKFKTSNIWLIFSKTKSCTKKDICFLFIFVPQIIFFRLYYTSRSILHTYISWKNINILKISRNILTSGIYRTSSCSLMMKNVLSRYISQKPIARKFDIHIRKFPPHRLFLTFRRQNYSYDNITRQRVACNRLFLNAFHFFEKFNYAASFHVRVYTHI